MIGAERRASQAKNPQIISVTAPSLPPRIGVIVPRLSSFVRSSAGMLSGPNCGVPPSMW